MDKQTNLLTIEAELVAAESRGGSSLSRTISEHEESGRYTGARLKSQRPEIATAASLLLKAGYGYQETADALNLNFYTVQALAAEDPEAVAVGKKQTARLAGNVGRVALERINDYLQTATVKNATDAQKLAMVAGIAIDKAQVLDGEPTAIVRDERPRLTDAAGFMGKLLSSGQPVPAGKGAALKGSGPAGSGADAGEVVEEVQAVAELPGGALVAASRRVIQREAGAKAEAVAQVVDVQECSAPNQETSNQSGDVPGLGAAENGGACDGAEPATRGDQKGGRGGPSKPAGSTE